MKKTEVIIIGIILISFALGIYLYPQMPENMASHWDAQGRVNGYMPKLLGLFLMPFISIILFLLFVIIPKIDPLEFNIKKFRNHYDRFVMLVIIFLFYIYLLSIFWNFNDEFDMIQMLSPAFAILFYYCGILIENAKRNWFIGIRTPWTMSNEKVWNKTHKIGGKLFKITGLITLFGIVFPGYAIFFIIVPIILVVAYTFVYSYFEYRKETRK
ncbi:MAG: SdpI family protein [Candidatus Aenigmatarchaeota archaeon]